MKGECFIEIVKIGAGAVSLYGNHSRVADRHAAAAAAGSGSTHDWQNKRCRQCGGGFRTKDASNQKDLRSENIFLNHGRKGSWLL